MSVPVPAIDGTLIDSSFIDSSLVESTWTSSTLAVCPSEGESAVAETLPEEGPSDERLLRAFIAASAGSADARDALSRIVTRHGTMVYQVALRTTGDSHLADDAFQATFLVLAQSARKIVRTASLAAWLHGTVRNIGRRAAAQKHAARKQATGQGTTVDMLSSELHDPLDELARSHDRQLLDDELQKLPDQHRAPLVLYYLEERSQEEISQCLGITVAAVESRLKRAKQELRNRLMRRGVTLSLALAALGALSSPVAAAPPAALVSSTIFLASTGTALSTTLSAGTASSAIQLAGKELATMSATTKMSAFIMGSAGTLTVGGALLFGAVLDRPEAEATGEPVTAVVVSTDQGASEEEDTPSSTVVQAPQLQPRATVVQAPQPSVGGPAELNPFGGGEMSYSMSGPRKASSGTDGNAALVARFRSLSARDLKVYETLDQELELALPDNTLKELADVLHTQTGLTVRLDQSALTNEGIDGEARLSFEGKHPLADSLSMLLQDVNGIPMDYYVDRGILHITTEDAMSNNKVSVRFYDLCEDEDGEQPGIKGLASAVQLYVVELQDTGETEIESVTPLGDSLAIRASIRGHKQVEEFITGAMRLAESRRKSNRPLPVVSGPADPSNGTGNQSSGQSLPGGGGGFGGAGGGMGGGGGFFSIR